MLQHGGVSTVDENRVCCGAKRDFRKALIATGRKMLFRSIGNQYPMDTILTGKELCGILAGLRGKLKD